MQDNSIRSGRTLALMALASVFVVFVATAALLAGFLVWSAIQIDEDALDRQSSRIVHVLSAQLEIMPHEQESFAIWDDTLVALSERDLDWLDANVGGWSYTYFGHDETYIISPGDTVAYASVGGRRTGLDHFANWARIVAPLLADVRSQASLGYADTPPRESDYVLLGGRPAITSVMPIVSDSGKLRDQPGNEPMLVSIAWLDMDYELGLIDRYMMEVGRFTTTTGAPEMAAFPVTNRSGRIVAFCEWLPYRPGQELLIKAVPALLVAFVVLGGVVGLLLHRLWRSSLALESKRREAERQAAEDSLTGLPNRLSFESRFDALLRHNVAQPATLGLLMLDLDRFKQVNDTLGHHAGDDLIRLVGERLRLLVGADAVLARLGGDEFGILCRNPSGEAELMGLAQRIIEAIALPFRIEGSEAFVGVSIGIVVSDDKARDRRELTRKADIALYEAKSSGRNRARVYEEAMNELVQNRHTIEAELRDALKQGDQLWVAFQPLFGRNGGDPIGAEALVRWTHPRLGYVSPTNFVGIAETSGLIESLGEFVMRRACELGARWPGHVIAVNISPAQLRNPGFADRVFGLLAETEMRPEDLEIEITEGILLDDEMVASAAIRSFRAAGIRIALDDFGTGYSSLNYLKRYPVDRIKIDRSFISQLSHASASNAIVQAMVTLAHALGIAVTAEGVETADQRRILTTMGCDTFQGFLFSPPLSCEDISSAFARPVLPPQARVA